MKLLSGVVFLLVLLFSFPQKQEKIIRMNTPSFSAETANIRTIEIEINDTIPNKTLKIYEDKNGYPLKYSRDIMTGVCIDGKCRLVAINLFWNSTGRYLGFELPAGEFLSKTEHDPFNAFEYDRLHYLLSEFNSPLADYTINELVPTAYSSDKEIDAISSATIAAVLDHVVEGAVYTSHTLWHIVYGPTQREIERLCTNKLNSELALLLLNSNNMRDQVWTLNRISPAMEISPTLQNKLIEFISGSDIYLAERAINALKVEMLTAETQMSLIKVFTNTGFLQKRLIIDKLHACSTIDNNVVKILTAHIHDLNGTLVKNLLELYKRHKIKDTHTIAEVAKLLKNDNRYIANQAVLYLNTIDNLDKKTKKDMNRFQKRNS